MSRSLNIALIGYGKMGKAIETIAIQKGHSIVLKISSSNKADLTTENLQKADVAIEFTNPETAVQNIKACLDAGTAVICGSTGWTDKEDDIKKYCSEKNGSLLYASNFSIGVNIFFDLNRKLAAMMQQRNEYTVTIKEIHHTAKKDAPSGTAISLAQQIVNERDDKTGWAAAPENAADKITITSERTDPAPGTHHVMYSSAIDNIEIIHTAHSREGFAAGAVIAAEFIAGKKGIFSMADVLKDIS